MKIIVALIAAALLTPPLAAAPCRDAKGHFTKCPPASATSSSGIVKGKDGKCRYVSGKNKGKFAKCP